MLTLPKKDAAIRLIVNDEDVAALFAACERQPTARQVALARAVLSVLATARCVGRRSAICAWRHEPAGQSILVRSGKGGKRRKVFVCADAVNALREWLATRENDSKHEYLFGWTATAACIIRESLT